jgi:hypothetical protein
MLYNEHDLENSMSKIDTINFHQEIEHEGIKFWCYHAGHVLGAAMFMIEIAGVRVGFNIFSSFFVFNSYPKCIFMNARFYIQAIFLESKIDI